MRIPACLRILHFAPEYPADRARSAAEDYDYAHRTKFTTRVNI